MTKSNKNLFIGAFVVIGAGAYLVYRFATKAKPIGIDTPKDKEETSTTNNETKALTKTEAVNIIINAGKHSNSSTISGFDLAFLRAWANAVTNKKDTFSYSGKNYKTQGGMVSQGIVSSLLPVASYPLKKGSKGSNVLALQKWLNDNGYASPKLVADGDFGAKTEIAVKNMQENANEKRILDYNLWNKDYRFGQVSYDFMAIFVFKTKPMPKLDGGLSDFGLGL